MGVYDFVIVEPEVDLPSYNLDTPQSTVSWQTRAFRDPMYRLHLISDDGYLYRADQNHVDGNGLVESHGDTGSFSFIEKIQDRDNYTGYPREISNFEWYRIRFVGDMRITAQTDEWCMYDFDFERHGIGEIDKVEDGVLGDKEDFASGDLVYDLEDTAYRIVQITDKIAKEYIAKEEVVDRGHTIYQEKTVADLNSDYPEDDIVVEIEPVDGGRTIPVPISRLEKNPFRALK